MENEKGNKGLAFKDFLDKSTNLITLFGVFNALLIYSSTLDDEAAAGYIFSAFFLLSLFVWFELILFTLASSDESIKYQFFFILLCIVQWGLVWYFIVTFIIVVILLFLFGILCLLIYLFMQLFLLLFFRYLAKKEGNRRKNLILILMAFSIILSGVTMKLTSPITKAFFEKIIPSKDTWTNKQKEPDKL